MIKDSNEIDCIFSVANYPKGVSYLCIIYENYIINIKIEYCIVLLITYFFEKKNTCWGLKNLQKLHTVQLYKIQILQI